MAVWHLELFGGVSLRNETRTLGDLVGKKAGALLALLALAPGRTRPREEVIDLLWPEVDYEEARVRFRQVLTQLRKLLEPAGVAPGSVLIADRTQVGIAQEHQSDVARFLHHLRRAANSAEPAERVRNLRAALALYTGEFAPGFYVDALLTERERLAALAESARERLATLEATLPETDPGPMIYEGQTVAPARVRTANRFFGREHERAEIRELLQSHRLVTLLGPGGTGKTRLTQELLADLPGAYFISLSALRNGENIANSIISVLALPDSNEPAIPRLQAAFAEKPALLVLDNVEQLVSTGGAESVAVLLDALPTVRLLVTSRIRLDLPQECVYRLGPLIRPAAIELFVDRARLANTHFELTGESQEAISELCRRLDGLPLAIELAAARAAVLTPQQILERLSRRFDLLADKRRDREERHMSLRAALDWGWSLLAPDVQRFFTQLCVFRGSFSLEAAEAITGEFLAVDTLQNLVDASFLLVESGGTGQRFVLLETLREYGAEKLEPSEQEALVLQHADFFLERATEWRPMLDGPEVLATMARFKQEHDNFVGAVEKTLALDPQRAVALCIMVAQFWDHSYWRRPALHYLTQALAATERVSIPEDRLARLYNSLGIAYRRVKDYDNAFLYFQKAYDYYQAQLATQRAAGESEEFLISLNQYLAGMLHNLGSLHEEQFHFDEAGHYFAEAAALNEAIGNSIWLARNHQGLATVYMRRGLWQAAAEGRETLFELAVAHAEKGTRLCREVQDQFFLCHLLHIQSYLLPLLGRTPQALPILIEGFALACALDHRIFIIGFLHRYHEQALHAQLWEAAVQFKGGARGFSQRWEESFEPNDANLRTPIDLPALLGQERYDALYQSGFDASLESLQGLAATLHGPIV
ncbi:MAG: AAA family ATPase [Armatimonas sp.]